LGIHVRRTEIWTSKLSVPNRQRKYIDIETLKEMCTKQMQQSGTMKHVEKKLFEKKKMLYVQFWAPDDWRWNRLKRVDHFAKINELYNVALCSLCLRILYWLYSYEFPCKAIFIRTILRRSQVRYF
jgi:hypothetical protein